MVLFSDGKETVPSNPDSPKCAYTAAHSAKEQGVPISTICFGTPYGYVEIDDQRQPVAVDNETMQEVAKLSSISELRQVYSTLQQQIGYETVPGGASAGWLKLGTLFLALAMLAGILISRRLPG